MKKKIGLSKIEVTSFQPIHQVKGGASRTLGVIVTDCCPYQSLSPYVTQCCAMTETGFGGPCC